VDAAVSGGRTVITRHGHQAVMSVTIDPGLRLSAAERPDLADCLLPIPTAVDQQHDTIQPRPADL